jgi:phosphatidate phosphatase APP1
MRSGKEHKRLSLARMFAAYPKTKFVLIGDSGQNDPYVYVEAAREHPRQVRAIVILDVGDHMAERAQELVRWQAELDEEGIPFYFVADAKEAASVMVHHRMVKKDVVTNVAEQILERGDS